MPNLREHWKDGGGPMRQDDETISHRVQCAAITRGCLGAFLWQDHSKEITGSAEEALRLNGWRLDHGEWVCGVHD